MIMRRFPCNPTTILGLLPKHGSEMTQKPKPRTIELVKSSYQPTKAELEEEITFPDLTFEEGTRRLVQDIKPRWIDKPRSRR